MKKRKVIEGDLFNTPGFFEEFVKVQGFVIIDKVANKLVKRKLQVTNTNINSYVSNDTDVFDSKWQAYNYNSFDSYDIMFKPENFVVIFTDIPEEAILFDTKTEANEFLIELDINDIDISDLSIIKYLDLE